MTFDPKAFLKVLSQKQHVAREDGAWMETPWAPFKVRVAFLGKKEWSKIGKECTRIGFNDKTHRQEEVMDDDKFRRVYAERVIKDWTGLTATVVEKVLSVAGMAENTPEEGVPFSLDVAIHLLANSNNFDNWLADVALKEELYSEALKRQELENLGESSAQS